MLAPVVRWHLPRLNSCFDEEDLLTSFVEDLRSAFGCCQTCLRKSPGQLAEGKMLKAGGRVTNGGRETWQKRNFL